MWGKPRQVTVSGKPHRVPFAVNLPKELVDPIRMWIKDSGLVYAVKRVKSLKTWAIHILAGETSYSIPWFRTKIYKKVKIPRLKMFEYLVDNRHNLKRLRLLLIVLNSYKQVVVGEPSLKTIMETQLPRDTKHYASLLCNYVDLPRVPKSVLEPTQSVNTGTKFCDDYGVTFSGPIGRKDDDLPAEIALVWADENDDPRCIGKVIAIPDKGKWRNILVGHWAIQLKTKKLADWLRRWLWRQPEVTSGDQTKFSDFIIKSQNLDKFVLSIDLSEATDRLDRQLQKELLIRMGVPRPFFDFLELPFFYQAEMFGKGQGLRKGRYAVGQPMGLYLSFPMFELLHYVILKFVCAVSNDADFRICGDDVVIACGRKEAENLYGRYVNLVERLGGSISVDKTLKSSIAAEGVGALFLRGYPKAIRIPSGKLSTLEATTPGTWLYQAIQRKDPLARAIHSSWLELSLEKRYTYEQRRIANEDLVSTDLSDWHVEALRQLVSPDNMPLEYPIWDDHHYRFWRKTPEVDRSGVPYRWISNARYRDSLVTHKLIRLYKQEMV